MKVGEFDKEAPQIFRLERAAFVIDKGPSENGKSGVKPTPSKTQLSSGSSIDSEGIMYFFINNTLDFKRSLAWQAVTNSSLISFPDQGSEKVRRCIDTIFQDIWTIEQSDPSMVKMYLDSIEALLKSLKKLYLGFLFIRENRKTEDGDITIGHYFLINQSAYICCGDRNKELIHRILSACPHLDQALQKAIKTNDDMYVWLTKKDVDSEYKGSPNLCPDCQLK